MPRKKSNSAQKSPKQPAIYRQKRRDGRDTAFTVIGGQRIHLGVFDTPEAEKEYRRIVAELVLWFLKERKKKASLLQWDKEQRICTILVSFYGDIDATKFDVNCLRTVRNEFILERVPSWSGLVFVIPAQAGI